MEGKTSSEIQEIFLICRNDVRRLEQDGVLHPEKHGNGKASLFGEDDLDRLLAAKMYLLAGFRISDMKSIINEDYNSEDAINEQIRIYKKRIMLLEFIKAMKEYVQEFMNIYQSQVQDASPMTEEQLELLESASDAMRDILWESVKIIFIADHLSQKASIDDDAKSIAEQVYSAYKIIERLSDLLPGEHVYLKDIIVDWVKEPLASENEIRETICEILEYYKNNQDLILKENEENNIEPITSEMNPEVGKVIQNVMNTVVKYAFEYFMNEDDMFYICTNLLKFKQQIDLDALEQGDLRLKEKNKK